MDEPEVSSGLLALVAGRPTFEERIGPASTRRLAIRAFGAALAAIAVGAGVASGEPREVLREPAIALAALALSAPSGVVAWLLFHGGPLDVFAVAVARGTLVAGLVFLASSPLVGLAGPLAAHGHTVAVSASTLAGAVAAVRALEVRTTPAGPEVAALLVQLAAALVLLVRIAAVTP